VRRERTGPDADADPSLADRREAEDGPKQPRAAGAEEAGSVRVDRRGILALAYRGVTHVRGKDCVHPGIGRVVVKDDLFSCPGERTTGVGPCARRGRERSSS
jgi:hypothetical protein